MTSRRARAERTAARERRLRALPAQVRSLRHQWLGRRNAGCYATYGVHEACDFSCTACYLGKGANKAAPLPWTEVRRQLDAIRAVAGPGANTQITAGEVTLLPVVQLCQIVRYARAIGLDPMVMTHGETFRRDPSYLRRLVTEAGLQKVAIHVDSTQRGRRGVPRVPRERDLLPVRDDFARLLRETRAATGRPLYAAHTVTVTDDNLAEVPALVRWALANADAFRLLSLQPAARVGRTRAGDAAPEADALWAKVCEGAGRALDPHTFHFGHPACNQISLCWVLRAGEDAAAVEAKRAGEPWDEALFDQLTHGPFMDFVTDGRGRAARLAALVSMLARHPRYGLQWPLYAAYRGWTERAVLGRFVRAALRARGGRVSPFAIVVHRFMDAEQLRTDEGRQRLRACAFQVPVGQEMVSMCQFNATGLRDAVHRSRRSLRVTPA